MSVYVRGMEMPKSCWECPMVSGYEIADEARTICSTVRCRLTNTKRPAGEALAPDCPLSPVQPHGDLIDRDKLREKEFIHEGDAYATVMSRDIRNAPTIIPAEEEE